MCADSGNAARWMAVDPKAGFLVIGESSERTSIGGQGKLDWQRRLCSDGDDDDDGDDDGDSGRRHCCSKKNWLHRQRVSQTDVDGVDAQTREDKI